MVRRSWWVCWLADRVEDGGRGVRGVGAADGTPTGGSEAGLPLVPTRPERHPGPSPHERTPWRGRARFTPYGPQVPLMPARWRKLSGVTLRPFAAVPPRPSHVEARQVPCSGPARLLQGRALRAVVVESRQFVAREQDTVGADDPPPRNSPSVEGHHAPDLARSALLQPLGHIAVRHDSPGRDQLSGLQGPLGVLRQGVRRKALVAHPAHPAPPHRQCDEAATLGVSRPRAELAADCAPPHRTLMPLRVSGACHHRAGGDR
ncbi:hypothetical protein STRTUCAR8_07304 [Streptomyces turgidiscabies Car8]|uniref:Uncharacterized protein n=1 Tax=Streptomyces turgidiscabies (strain Car8) TaxID=698760 RepID=L7ESM1_STRT8|nr:hypothetical protein STRTUCAR8_07304 [Streptomyces turgidiscabies Car8]